MSVMPNGIDLEKRLLRVENVVGENVKQVEIKNDIKFPVKVKKIWDVDAEVEDVEFEIIDDKVIVTGTIHKQIFFVADENREVDGERFKEGEVFEKTVKEEFTEFVDVPGAMEDFDAQVDVRIEFVDHEDIRDNDKDKDKDKDKDHDFRWGDDVRDVWRQIVVLEIFVKVVEVVQLEVVTDVIAPGKDLEVVKELLKVDSVIGENEVQTEVIRDIDFPRGKKVKKVKEVITEVKDVETEIIPDKVIVEGILHKQIIFVEKDSNRVFEKSIDEPFTVSVEIPGAMEDQDVFVDVDVEFVDVDLMDGDKKDGFKKARQTAVLDVFVKVTEALQIEVVVDVIGEGIDVISELLKVQGVIGENERQVNLRSDIFFDRPIKKVIDTITDVKVNRKDSEIIDDKVIVQGKIEKQIFFVDKCDEAVFEKTVKEEFTTFVDVPGARRDEDQNVQIHVDVEFVDHHIPKFPDWICGAFKDKEFDPEDFPVEQTVVLNVFVKVTETLQIDVVIDVIAREIEEPPEPPEEEDEVCPEANIRIVMIQRGDTLFRLAQRFNTTVDAILELNPGIDPNNLQIGQQIRICVIEGAKG